MAGVPLNSGVYPVATGQPSYSGTYIPIIWSSRFITKFYLQSVMTNIVNTNYEGEVKNYGDTIRIPLIPDMVIRKYYDGQDLQTDRPRGDSIEIGIQRGHYFNALCTDVQKKQASIPFLDKWSTDAAEKMKIKVDGEVLNEVYADAHPLNSGATAGRISGNVDLGSTGSSLQIERQLGGSNESVLDAITKVSQVLDEFDIPNDGGRWIVMPAWMVRILKVSELAGADFSGDSQSMLRNGRIGTLDTFGGDVYQSNNLLPVDDGGNNVWHVIAGHREAITFISQMTNMETIRATNTFGDLMRGLQVYDFSVTNPEALVDLYCRPAP